MALVQGSTRKLIRQRDLLNAIENHHIHRNILHLHELQTELLLKSGEDVRQSAARLWRGIPPPRPASNGILARITAESPTQPRQSNSSREIVFCGQTGLIQNPGLACIRVQPARAAQLGPRRDAKSVIDWA